MAEIPVSLISWAGQTGPAKVIEAIRKRAVQGRSTERGVLSCVLDPAERKQVGRLLGVRWELSGRSVTLQALAARLPGITPLELVTAVTGPVIPHAQERARAVAEAAAERDRCRALLRGADVAEDVADSWLADSALPRPGSGELAVLVERVATVWRAVPDAPVHLARLAADVCGDAHALDDQRPLGRAVARLAAVTNGLERPSRSGPAWRAAWASIGVLCNEISSRVLVLNLALRGTGSAVSLCAAASGEPLWLTLRSLSGHWGPANTGTVFICENPTVVEAAADLLGEGCPPLVCTDGIASAAALTLIRGLAMAGCRIHARADFDRAGFVIVEQIRSAAPDMTTWRFDAETYGVASAGEFGPDSVKRSVHEEAILPLLLDDLAACGLEGPRQGR